MKRILIALSSGLFIAICGCAAVIDAGLCASPRLAALNVRPKAATIRKGTCTGSLQWNDEDWSHRAKDMLA